MSNEMAADEEIAGAALTKQSEASACILVDSQFKRKHDDAFLALAGCIVRTVQDAAFSSTQQSTTAVQIPLHDSFKCELLGALRNACAALASLENLSSADTSPPMSSPQPALLHGRRWWDAPEFHPLVRLQQTAGGEATRLGLWYDDTAESPSCVVHTSDRDTATVYSVAADSLPAALLLLTPPTEPGPPSGSKGRKRSREAHESPLRASLRSLAAQPSQVLAHASAQARKKACAGECWDGMGVTVSQAGSGTGWRPLQCTEAELQKLLQQEGTPAALSELFHFAHIANDERDFGMPLALGRGVWRLSLKHTSSACALMCAAYGLMGRQSLAKLAKRLAKARDKGAFAGPNMEGKQADASRRTQAVAASAEAVTAAPLAAPTVLQHGGTHQESTSKRKRTHLKAKK